VEERSENWLILLGDGIAVIYRSFEKRGTSPTAA
jgi:hypothetical protein